MAKNFKKAKLGVAKVAAMDRFHEAPVTNHVDNLAKYGVKISPNKTI